MKKTLLLLALLVSCLCAQAAETTNKPNILLIIADDLNNWIGPTKGHPQVITPNLDKLAKRGVIFQNTQAAAPLCNPSRASFMSGKRPYTTGIYDNEQPAMQHLPPGVCINDYLRPFGYTALGCGKIYHYRNYRAADWDKVVFYGDDTLPNHPADRRPGPFGYRMFTEDKPTEKYDEQRAESKLVDYRSVSWAIDQLQQQTNTFFLACGVHRPHTPWDVPKKYYDMYDLKSVKLPEVITNDLDDIPPAGIHFAKPNGVHKQIVKLGLWQDRVRGYLAAVTYADAQIGRLLDALDKSKFKDNTIIVFVGDNGWHLGQKEHWGKSALWREATRVPMIWYAPGVTKPGTECMRAVDLMSLFPTLCELAGVPTPKHAEGISIKPLLANPTMDWKQPAISTYLQNNHAICTEDWRYIHYADGSDELYNEKSDPFEWTNVVKNVEFASVKADLAKYLPTVNAKPVPHVDGSSGEEEITPQKKNAIRKAKKDGTIKTPAP